MVKCKMKSNQGHCYINWVNWVPFIQQETICPPLHWANKNSPTTPVPSEPRLCCFITLEHNAHEKKKKVVCTDCTPTLCGLTIVILQKPGTVPAIISHLLTIKNKQQINSNRFYMSGLHTIKFNLFPIFAVYDRKTGDFLSFSSQMKEKCLHITNH